MSKKMPTSGLSDDEFIELEELLAALPEERQPMEADEADGFLTGLLLSPAEVSPSVWMPYILDSEGSEPKGDPDTIYRLEDLLYRRYQEIDQQLAGRTPIDPLIFVEDDEPEGDELAPFALGVLAAVRLFPGLENTGSKSVDGALLGIFRHLPKSAQGDLAETIAALDNEEPLGDAKEALEDLAACVAEIAEVTRGFKIPD